MDKLSIKTIYALSLALSLSIILGSFYASQSTWAQNATTNTNTTNATTAIDTFRAQGQISSLASDTLAGRENSTENVMWVLGGDWEVNVAEGNLTNFVVDIKMTQVDGTAAHSHTIEKITNASGMPMGTVQAQELDLMTGEPGSKIALINGNATMFRGTVDLTTNGNVKWESVPTHVTIFNGNVINLGLDPSKTEDHFYGLPVFGTVESIVDENGKELLQKSK
ncbi:hypothetical protein [Candidatus Nitrosocosmicus hydrocola]|uniref:hypothetical protein n=1 Tax=Candidatus Nitrosocosmicus hydrocola TaxID=1826872 RepID=UPI0011E5EEE4|nr:hypothetical protein [Candidatus Nitrosocosmicus hydrocola]